MKKEEIQWLDDPCKQLREQPNGTMFLLQTQGNTMYLCVLDGNIPGDEFWKYHRYPDIKRSWIERDLKRGARFALIRQ